MTVIFRIFDVCIFIRQIFFPNWEIPEDDADTHSKGFIAAVLLLLRLFVTKNGVSILFSVLVHCVLLVCLSLIFMPKAGTAVGIDILGGFNLPPQPAHEAAAVLANKPKDKSEDESPAKKESVNESINVTETPAETEAAEPAENAAAAASKELSVTPQRGGFVSGGGFGNRNGKGRQAALGSGDCTQGGEDAVEAALEWLAAHQQTDGGWSLQFNDSCRQCSQSGTSELPRRTAATALALLPFLGAGYTHQEGKYRKTVERGLLYIINDPNNGIDGVLLQSDGLRMYSHGLAAIVLCEGYALSKPQRPESALGQAAQRALLTIETAQDPDGGGWRYRPSQSPGDTSVFAWQLMALKSGKLGGLPVSQSVLYGAYDFLESVSVQGGRLYNYLPSGGWDKIRGDDSPMTCSAVGLLMRMYLGWKPGDEVLDEGVAMLAKNIQRNGRLRHNLYFAYYAALMFHHYGGDNRQRWNAAQRDLLVNTQSHQGHESGSWYFPDPYCNSGGRLLNTALGAMILETPYRIMPLYRK
ncbi:MAG: terpene cyclase/mutase family protein [Planctomycetaceae bacterium]|jgi:hypothetical protein|nr:terpene cyclase/mutase family protein [Planctomycetaceae bacterium]